ncbi:hypothetical protein CJ030_MR0G007602 [Morella rubra]|uniref:Transmembrane protein n=1 Tax=Morella rubra TaxID=262757 RepID=A0A6A1UJE2_9ROSI|nr:hypothetical protein CJ030_MR0G007602 [Morella rubra]
MASVFFPTLRYSSRLISHSLPSIAQASDSLIPARRKPPKNGYVLGDIRSTTSDQPVVHSSFSTRRTSLALVPVDAKRSGSGEEDHQALETVLKLYNAIKDKNINELSDIIGDECRCVCNLFSFFQTFQGKMQVLNFLSALITFLGDNVELVVKPTLHDGLRVGVSWRLVWNKIPVSLGKGFSFHIMQVYQGKIYLRTESMIGLLDLMRKEIAPTNMEMFMEPLLYMEPLRLRLIAFTMTAMDKMDMYTRSKNKAKTAIFVLVVALFFIGACLLIL